ncbi:ferredoxin [Streptomyces sp. NPDC050504]|uniref:ferredoxin n=1 Tax=Streptomyces sp. NPDC050504 TaxID=3365618 RepID=UPI00379C068A
MELSTDPDRCVGAGLCALRVPEVFDQSPDDGLVMLLTEHPPQRYHSAVRTAAGTCPAAAIAVTEGDA